ncbi:MAG: hypothetical protein ACK5NA_01890 [Enterococcus sp.]
MKTSTKVSIGLSVAAAVGVATTVAVSGKVVEHIRHATTRCKVKKFVNEKFDGNERLLGIVDDLSDKELDSLMHVMTKIKDGRKRISVYGDSLKDSTDDLRARLMDFVDRMM